MPDAEQRKATIDGVEKILDEMSVEYSRYVSHIEMFSKTNREIYITTEWRKPTILVIEQRRDEFTFDINDSKSRAQIRPVLEMMLKG